MKRFNTKVSMQRMRADTARLPARARVARWHRPPARWFHVLAALLPCLASSPALGAYALYDDFTYPDTTFDRTKWWRGGLAGADGTNAILNESDLTSSMLFSGGDFKFVMGGPSATSQGLFGLGDIDDGDPYLILSDSGAGWHFHVRNGAEIYNGPVIASSLAKGDVVVFHWDLSGSSVSINGVLKDSQTTVHPPRMPLTMLEWNDTSASGQIILDSVSYSASTDSTPKPSATTPAASAQAMVLSATLVEDTFIDTAHPGTHPEESTHQICIRNHRAHPDLTGAGGTVDIGQLGLVQFTLPQLPAGWKVTSAQLAGMVAQNHNSYGMPGWAPDRPIELEVLGLSVNPDLTTVTYNALHNATGHGVITDYTASGSVNFTFGSQAQSLEVVRFNTSTTPVGGLLQFPDRQGKLRAFVRSKISQTGPRVITLALGPGRTQAVSGMDCDFKFYAQKNTAGRAPMSLTLELDRASPRDTNSAARMSGQGAPPEPAAPQPEPAPQQTPPRVVYFAGAFTKTGSYVWTNGMTLQDGIAVAGGLTHWANGTLRLIRRDGSQELHFFGRGRTLTNNPALQPDDVVLSRGQLDGF